MTKRGLCSPLQVSGIFFSQAILNIFNESSFFPRIRYIHPALSQAVAFPLRHEFLWLFAVPCFSVPWKLAQERTAQDQGYPKSQAFFSILNASSGFLFSP